MARCGNWPIGVCSWSLQTGIDGVARAMEELEVDRVHLGIRPALGEEGKGVRAALQKQSWTISSTMMDFPQEDYSSLERIRITGGIVPDDVWERNRELFFGAVEVTADLGVRYSGKRTFCGLCRRSDSPAPWPWSGRRVTAAWRISARP